MSYLLVFFAIFPLHSSMKSNSSGVVNRYAYGGKRNGFFHASVDSFSRTDADCKDWNAECVENVCEFCACKENDVFFSYKDGCLGYDQTLEKLQGKKCFTHELEEKEIAVLSDDNSPLCRFLYVSADLYELAKTFSRFGLKCYAREISEVDVVSGNLSVTIKNELQESFVFEDNVQTNDTSSSGLCLKWNTSLDALEKLHGNLLVVKLECVNEKYRQKMESCFIFKYNGTNKYSVRYPDLLKPTPLPNKSRWSSITTVFAVITFILLVLLVTLAVIFFIRKRRNDARASYIEGTVML